MLEAIINLLYPALCRNCFKKIDRPGRNICDNCAKDIKERLPPFCARCGRQLKHDQGPTAVCADCARGNPCFDKAWSACHYDGALKALIHDFKYKKITCLSGDFSALMINFMKKHGIGKDCDIILPIPMHQNRLFNREINHADILARELAKRLNIPFSKKALRKIKDTPLQSRLNREDRIKNQSSSFALKNSSVARNKNILLVDDLFTTGSTVNECSRLLKDSGASYVEVITLARGDSL